jgi:hypothetical protein
MDLCFSESRALGPPNGQRSFSRGCGIRTSFLGITRLHHGDDLTRQTVIRSATSYKAEAPYDP